jgi:hypothetical protein
MTAEQLASASDAVADALDAGDVCGAAGLADELNGQVVDAINAAQIPSAYQEDLQARANELVNEVNCPHTTTEEEKPKKDKKKKKAAEQEETVPTEPPPTFTDGEG